MSEAQNLPSESRALVPIETPSSVSHHKPTQCVAAFVAQLIATARQVPQTRTRNCADPAEVIAANNATMVKTRAWSAGQPMAQ